MPKNNLSYIMTTLPSIVNIKKLITVHYFEFDKNYRFDGESHNFWEIVYVDAGSVEVQSDDEFSVLGQGEAIFHRPNEFHSLRSFESTPNVFIVSFSCNSPVMKLFEKYKRKVSPEVKQLFSRIICEAQNTFVLPRNDPYMKCLSISPNAPIGGMQLIKNYLEEALILMARELNKKDFPRIFTSADNMESHLAAQVEKFISENCENHITVSDVCEKFGYSVTHLERIFKDATGCSIGQYYNCARIELAKKWIREDTLNFSQISERLCFDNPQYFSRVFRRVTRISPTEYKKSMRI